MFGMQVGAFLHGTRAAKLATKGDAPGVPLRGFEDILIEHSDALWRTALRLCNYNVQDAEDTFQEAAIRAFRGRASLEQVDNTYVWLHRVLTNTFLNRVRDSKRWNERLDLESAEGVADEPYESTPSALIDSVHRDVWNDDVAKALSALSEDSRSLFLLSDIEGYTHDELAAMYHLPKGTVSARIYRARKKLARLLEAYAVERGFVSKDDLANDRARMAEAMAVCADGERRLQEKQNSNEVTP